LLHDSRSVGDEVGDVKGLKIGWIDRTDEGGDSIVDIGRLIDADIGVLRDDLCANVTGRETVKGGDGGWRVEAFTDGGVERVNGWVGHVLDVSVDVLEPTEEVIFDGVRRREWHLGR
jgi:hypothetical protein